MDVDPSYGQGIYNAELQEPEHSNAGSTALWELPALQVSNLFEYFTSYSNWYFFIIFLHFRGIIILKYVNYQKP